MLKIVHIVHTDHHQQTLTVCMLVNVIYYGMCSSAVLSGLINWLDRVVALQDNVAADYKKLVCKSKRWQHAARE